MQNQSVNKDPEGCLTDDERATIEEACKRETIGPILEGEAAIAALRWLEQLRDQIQASLPPLTDEEREQLVDKLTREVNSNLNAKWRARREVCLEDRLYGREICRGSDDPA